MPSEDQPVEQISLRNGYETRWDFPEFDSSLLDQGSANANSCKYDALCPTPPSIVEIRAPDASYRSPNQAGQKLDKVKVYFKGIQ